MEPMRNAVSSRVSHILQGLRSFCAPGVVPGDVPLEPTDTLLGVLALDSHTAAILLDRGAYLRIGEDWCLVPYGAIEVRFPPKDVPMAPLTLVTSMGNIDILAGTPDALEAGRFFMRCAEDASAI
jgi:hypothetical protein